MGDSGDLVPFRPVVPQPGTTLANTNPFRQEQERVRLREVARRGDHIIVKPAPAWDLNNIGDLVHDVLDHLETDDNTDEQHTREYVYEAVKNLHNVLNANQNVLTRALKANEHSCERFFHMVFLFLITCMTCIIMFGLWKQFDFGV